MESADRALIPGLPDEIAMECLIRVPYNFHSNMKSVCHTWQNLLSSPSFYQQRIKSDTAERFVCQIQPLPPKDSTHVLSEFATIHNTKKEEDRDQQHQQQPRQQQQQHQQINTTALQYVLNVYNCTNQTWQRIRPSFEAGKTWEVPMFCQCVAVQSRGKLLILGGWDPTTLEPVSDVYVLDMIKGSSWRRAAPMSVPRSFFACAVVGGSKVYVAGGHDNQKNALRSAEVYDVDADEWRMLPEMEEERDECQGMCWHGDDKFWVVSGYGTESQGRFKSDAECYDPVTGSWSKIEGLWPFPNISPRGTTTTTTTTERQHQWLWFLSKEQQQLQQHGGAIREYEDKERRWKMVRSIVPLPNTITGTSPCVSVTTLGVCDKASRQQKERVFVMTGNSGSGSGNCRDSSLTCCECECECECEREGGFIVERENKNGNTKWNHLHLPAGFSGFPYSASYIFI